MSDEERGKMLKILWTIRNVLLFVGLLVGTMTMSCIAASADEGFYELMSDDIGVLYSIYLPSVEDRGDYIVAWVKKMLREPEPIKNKVPDYVMTLFAANKNLKQMQILSQALYDKDGNVIEFNNFKYAPDNWLDCIPNTHGETFWYFMIKMNDVLNKKN